MKKEQNPVATDNNLQIDESLLFEQVVNIIENRKRQAGSFANQAITLMYWEIGKYVGSVLLGGERAKYGKQIVATLSQQLSGKYGKSFEYTKITRMIKFAELFPDVEILATLSQELSWSHFIEILPLKTLEARLYYAKDAAVRHLGIRDLRVQISRKAYERCEIANSTLTEASTVPFNMFKDPYLLDVLGLKDNFLEADLEKAILSELEAFILEFGQGFTFVERQKRMTMDGDDFTLDLLFFNRKLKRLVAVELKIGRFKPQYMGQMRFYLKWLDKYERQEGENPPIGLILCPTASRDQIELMELSKEGIAVAQYWTELPPKAEFERKIKEILSEAQERLERRKTFPIGEVPKQIEYFYEPKNNDIEEDN
ncbi:PDDEXK nuclease domain-containing protein [Candidatus Bathycorpusculum sp.]|uniref:PDDEXK nuclease domain-containing protein n=1 Tax=Candidatus Bathycorpusculum sp. TaxID=2994959 RepID=UPI00283070E0|nr:PDDEXK nuclease domain-containing protein [Candidatus Termitimicrobium sp.]